MSTLFSRWVLCAFRVNAGIKYCLRKKKCCYLTIDTKRFIFWRKCSAPKRFISLSIIPLGESEPNVRGNSCWQDKWLNFEQREKQQDLDNGVGLLNVEKGIRRSCLEHVETDDPIQLFRNFFCNKNLETNCVTNCPWWQYLEQTQKAKTFSPDSFRAAATASSINGLLKQLGTGTGGCTRTTRDPGTPNASRVCTIEKASRVFP